MNDEYKKLARETSRQAGRVSEEASRRMRRASEERLREIQSHQPGGSNNRPTSVPDNLISSGEE